MAQMNRNVNLEEINTDALFGIDALKHQTIWQKIIFFGCVFIGVLLNVCLPLFFNTGTTLCVILFMTFLGIGVSFGCNYTEDMTYGKYLFCFFFKPKKYLLYESTEDERWMKKKAEEIRKSEEEKLRMSRQMNPEGQKKMLIKLIVFVVIFVAIMAGMFIYSGTREEKIEHHTVDLREAD